MIDRKSLLVISSSIGNVIQTSLSLLFPTFAPPRTGGLSAAHSRNSGDPEYPAVVFIEQFLQPNRSNFRVSLFSLHIKLPLLELHVQLSLGTS